MAAVRVGILGAGMAAEGHATAYHQLPDVRVVGIWNRSRVGQRRSLLDLSMSLASTTAGRT